MNLANKTEEIFVLHRVSRWATLLAVVAITVIPGSIPAVAQSHAPSGIANAPTTDVVANAPPLADVLINTPNFPDRTEGRLWVGMIYLNVNRAENLGMAVQSVNPNQFMVVKSLTRTQFNEDNGTYSAPALVRKFFTTGDTRIDDALIEQARAEACTELHQCTLRVIIANPTTGFDFIIP